MGIDEKDRVWQPGNLERVRSTPLRPAVWMTSVLMWATVIALILRVPTWAGIFLCTVTGVSFLWFLVCYIYLFVSDREALRGERWRGRLASESPHYLSAQQRPEPNADAQEFLGPGRAGLTVPALGVGEQPVDVGEADRVREG